jgi:hypothetical protein
VEAILKASVLDRSGFGGYGFNIFQHFCPGINGLDEFDRFVVPIPLTIEEVPSYVKEVRAAASSAPQQPGSFPDGFDQNVDGADCFSKTGAVVLALEQAQPEFDEAFDRLLSSAPSLMRRSSLKLAQACQSANDWTQMASRVWLSIQP